MIDPRFNEHFPISNPALFADSDAYYEAEIRPRRQSASDRTDDIHPGLRAMELSANVVLPKSYCDLFDAGSGLADLLASYLKTAKNASIAMAKDALTIWPDPGQLLRANKWVREGDWEGMFAEYKDEWPEHLIAIGDNNHGDYFAIEAGVGDENPPVLLVSHDPPCVVRVSRHIEAFIESQRSVAAICFYNGFMTRPAAERAALLTGLVTE